MKYHHNWENAKKRFTDLWEGKPTRIPYIGIRAPVKEQPVSELNPPAKDEDFWLDPDWMIAKLEDSMENTHWLGEIVPGILLMSCWLISLGGKPEFDRKTIWFDQYPEIDFSKPSPFRHDKNDPWFLKFKHLFEVVVKTASERGFWIGAHKGLPANDLLSMHMGTDNFFIAMMEHPEWVKDAIVRGAEDQLSVFIEFLKFAEKYLGDSCYCGTGWMPFWAPVPFLRTQSDVSCMLSPEMFETFILPELEIYGKSFPLWYHLDGGNAKQHLPVLLSLPYLKVLQYVPMPSEPRNGIEHIEFYQQVQKAGKIVHIEVGAEKIKEEFIKELDPSKILIDTNCGSLDEAEALLDKIAKWCGR